MNLYDYRDKLYCALEEVTSCQISMRTIEQATAIIELLCQLDTLDSGEHKSACDGLSKDEAKRWAARMENADGTTGAHWTMEQTNAVAEERGVSPDDVSRWAWGVTMNMMYSDYYAVAAEFGVDRPEFYAALAQAFLMDKDAPAPEEKLCEYYKHIASRG